MINEEGGWVYEFYYFSELIKETNSYSKKAEGYKRSTRSVMTVNI